MKLRWRMLLINVSTGKALILVFRKDKQILSNHYRISPSMNTIFRFETNVCGKAFDSKTTFSAYKKWHNEEYRKRFKCPHCNYSNSRNNRLKEHINKYHKLEIGMKTKKT